MNQKQNSLRIILRIIGFGFGLISILGGIAAIGRAREPERYLVSAVVMVLGGILCLGYSIIPKYLSTQKNPLLIGMILFLGLTLGLFYTFNFCGGECGCFQYRGYPGYWLKGSTCVTNRAAPIRMGSWKIDAPGLVADVVFWIDTGLILSFVRKFTNVKPLLVENKK